MFIVCGCVWLYVCLWMWLGISQLSALHNRGCIRGVAACTASLINSNVCTVSCCGCLEGATNMQ